MRNSTTTKRAWIAAAAFMVAAGLGACADADQPMGIEEGYEVQMDGNSGNDGNCVIIDGQVHCKD